MKPVQFEWVEFDDPRVLPLIEELTEFLADLDQDKAPFFQSYSKLKSLDALLLATVDGEPAGCGGYRQYEPGTGEIKRMYVRPAFRGHGIGRGVLGQLEDLARKGGAQRLILETHRDLAPALALYHGAGFQRIPQYPPYEGVEISVCLGKSLVG